MTYTSAASTLCWLLQSVLCIPNEYFVGFQQLILLEIITTKCLLFNNAIGLLFKRVQYFILLLYVWFRSFLFPEISFEIHNGPQICILLLFSLDFVSFFLKMLANTSKRQDDR